MGVTRKMARGSGKPSWAFTYVLVGILAVILGFLWGSLRGHPRSGTSIEPILRLTDLRWDGWSGNAVLRLVITNGTSVDWTFPVRIPNLFRSSIDVIRLGMPGRFVRCFNHRAWARP